MRRRLLELVSSSSRFPVRTDPCTVQQPYLRALICEAVLHWGTLASLFYAVIYRPSPPTPIPLQLRPIYHTELAVGLGDNCWGQAERRPSQDCCLPSGSRETSEIHLLNFKQTKCVVSASRWREGVRLVTQPSPIKAPPGRKSPRCYGHGSFLEHGTEAHRRSAGLVSVVSVVSVMTAASCRLCRGVARPQSDRPPGGTSP
ncbi:unnamed protein product [Pleuronectes platessa]|uniref:Uncharacterized protein n=1 Tax=Pleuronectes platessa TaxID=8262 RepID=A0A9N7VUJ7_PLEPL|nr:unnamed protein product [Pleuronectes platessa]